jgi:hypothetical protein
VQRGGVSEEAVEMLWDVFGGDEVDGLLQQAHRCSLSGLGDDESRAHGSLPESVHLQGVWE